MINVADQITRVISNSNVKIIVDAGGQVIVAAVINSGTHIAVNHYNAHADSIVASSIVESISLSVYLVGSVMLSVYAFEKLLVGYVNNNIASGNVQIVTDIMMRPDGRIFLISFWE